MLEFLIWYLFSRYKKGFFLRWKEPAGLFAFVGIFQSFNGQSPRVQGRRVRTDGRTDGLVRVERGDKLDGD